MRRTAAHANGSTRFLPWWGELRTNERTTELTETSVGTTTLQWGQLSRIPRVNPPLKSTIAKHNAEFAKKKRPKDYSSDSSASAVSTDGKTEGRIYKMPAGSAKDYYVYWKGKKITFGDSSMKNRNNNDGARENFMARHNCSEKKDKSKAGYWYAATLATARVSTTHAFSLCGRACRVWRKGYKGPDKG